MKNKEKIEIVWRRQTEALINSVSDVFKPKEQQILCDFVITAFNGWNNVFDKNGNVKSK